MDEDAWYGPMRGRRGRENLSTNLRYNSGRGQSQVGLVFERDVVIPSAPSLGKSQTIRCPGTRVSTRKKKQRGKQKLTSSFGYARRMQVSEFIDRTEVMPK